MTVKEAYRVLGLPTEASLHEIKKRYRKLMLQVHPDVSIRSKEKYAYSAQEINTAYSILKEAASGSIRQKNHRSQNSDPKRKRSAAWSAPLNHNAYKEREVLQYVEDYDGAILGSFCIAEGKYMWTTEEEFSLFLLSLYQCSKGLLDEADALLRREEPPANRPLFQAELTYLLAQQFISQTALLTELTKENEPDPEGNRIFYIPSMLETPGKTAPLKGGEALYPGRIRQHRLYLKNQTGQELGYLSFLDDRLYYIVVPLFEQKAVRLKILAAKKQPEKKNRISYQNLHLWIKLSNKNDRQLPENLNLQIEGLLEKYRH